MNIKFKNVKAKTSSWFVWKVTGRDDTICGHCGYTIPKESPRLLIDNVTWTKFYLCPVCIKYLQSFAEISIGRLPPKLIEQVKKVRKMKLFKRRE